MTFCNKSLYIFFSASIDVETIDGVWSDSEPDAVNTQPPSSSAMMPLLLNLDQVKVIDTQLDFEDKVFLNNTKNTSLNVFFNRYH